MQQVYQTKGWCYLLRDFFFLFGKCLYLRFFAILRQVQFELDLNVFCAGTRAIMFQARNYSYRIHPEVRRVIFQAVQSSHNPKADYLMDKQCEISSFRLYLLYTNFLVKLLKSNALKPLNLYYVTIIDLKEKSL